MLGGWCWGSSSFYWSLNVIFLLFVKYFFGIIYLFYFREKMAVHSKKSYLISITILALYPIARLGTNTLHLLCRSFMGKAWFYSLKHLLEHQCYAFSMGYCWLSRDVFNISRLWIPSFNNLVPLTFFFPLKSRFSFGLNPNECSWILHFLAPKSWVYEHRD